VFAQPQTDDRNVVVTVVGAVQEITGRKRAEEALEKRLVALTKPLETSETIAFEDLFNLPDIQRLQDEFSTATGVASIITRTDGTPITAPSNFCRLCKDIIRKTDKGYLNCLQSDAVLGSFNLEGPTIQPCLSGGLWDAGAAISVGGKHIANWLIGQVRDETQTEEKIRAYARIIGVDETLAVDAFHEVPAMSREKFGQVSRALFTLANQLSSIAYQNVQQARFITERQQAEEALRQSEARLKMTLQSTQVGTWEWNIQTGETVFNERWAEIVGYTLAELSPTNVQTWSNFIHPDDLSIAYQRLDTHFAGESSHYEGEFRMKHRHGHWVWVWYRGMVMEWTVDGKPLRMFGTHIDITSRKQSEEKIERYQTHLEDMVKQRTVELEAANEQLLILSRVKDEFVSNVSHELRTPLTNLTLRYHLVETHPEQIEKHMGVIQREMARLAQTIENLLSLSRLDQGRIAVSLATVDLNEIIDHYVMDRTLVFNAKGLSLDFHQEPELPEIIADRGMLGQVLSILLTNANNYTPTGGRVMVSTHTRHELDRQWVGFSVSDTGPGISPDDQLKLFTRFFRGKVGRQSRVPGTGLGLAIAKEIVALHEGYIEVESDGMPGQGVTFTVWLPVKKEEKPVA
jgi:PAS domain S-box-containing protein